MAGITAVLSVVPTGVRPTTRQKFEPTWDSCDGEPSSYGWDSATVDLDWPYSGHPADVFNHVQARMTSLGWTLDAGSQTGAWTWTKTLTGNVQASAQLLGGPDTQPPDWSMEATAPPATHPVRGC